MRKTPQYKVMLLRVCFLLEIEAIGSAVGKIIKATSRWCRPAMHSKRAIAFVILTEESSDQLVDRLRPTLEGITSVENYWCHIIVDDVIGRHGAVDPLATYVREAWEELRKRNKPNYVRQSERPETIVVGYMQDFDRGAAIKMGVKGRRPWKAAENADRQEGEA
jgi:hypothetical protein